MYVYSVLKWTNGFTQYLLSPNSLCIKVAP